MYLHYFPVSYHALMGWDGYGWGEWVGGCLCWPFTLAFFVEVDVAVLFFVGWARRAYYS